jgi:hypothetical protein
MVLEHYPLPVEPWQLPLRRKFDREEDHQHNYYKAEVLDRYRNHKYIDIGYDQNNDCHYIRFLNTDSHKPPDSHVSFRFAKHGNDDVLKMKADQIINVPPSQIPHWFRHEVQVK